MLKLKHFKFQEGLRTRRVGGSLSLSEDEIDSEAEVYDPLNKRKSNVRPEALRWDPTLHDLCKALFEYVVYGDKDYLDWVSNGTDNLDCVLKLLCSGKVIGLGDEVSRTKF